MNVNIAPYISDIKKFAAKHSPEIMTAVGVIFMVGAVIVTGKNTPDAVEALERAKAKSELDKVEPKEIVKIAAKYYLPTVAMTVAGVGLITGASITNYKRNMALANACAFSEQALFNYKTAVAQSVTNAKQEEILAKEAENDISKHPSDEARIINTHHGDTLCHETITGQWFRSSMQYIQKVINETTQRMQEECCVSYNDFLYALGLDENEAGEALGWSVYKNQGVIKPHFSSILDEQGVPCLVLSFINNPTAQYRTEWYG